MKRTPVTALGAKKLGEELEYLKTVRRPKIILELTEAREHGDLKENAEYHAAREQQAFCEGRIKELELKLSQAEIIDVKKLHNTGQVIFGSTVTLLNLDTEVEHTYCIVGDDEANVKEKLISINSPMARGLIGKTSGETVTIMTPGGSIDYEVLSVAFI